MKQIINIVYFLLVIEYVHAQDSLALKTDIALTKIARNTVFVEILGRGGLYSINYDRIVFCKKKTKVIIRGGFSFIPLSHWDGLGGPWTVPMEMNLLIGKKHHFECGIGISYWYGAFSYRDDHDRIMRSISLWLVPQIIGYRFQKYQGGFFIKADIHGWFKIYEFNKQFNASYFATAGPGYGLGIGYTFKIKKIK